MQFTYCRPLYPKLAEPNLLMSSYELSIIDLTETWLISSVDKAEISRNFAAFRADRAQARRNGGLSLRCTFSLCLSHLS